MLKLIKNAEKQINTFCKLKPTNQDLIKFPRVFKPTNEINIPLFLLVIYMVASMHIT